MKFLERIPLTLGSFFYVGYLPFIPGTFGSAAGMLLLYGVKGMLPLQLLLTFALTAVGFMVGTTCEKMLHTKDPRAVVIDEVSGIFISFIGVPWNLKTVIFGFFVFRLLDTIKPYPAGKLQNLRGSTGIMLDDIVAGVYTNLILQVVTRVATFTIS